MPKLILNILFAFSGIFLISYFFYSSTNWKELSNKYSSKKKSNIFSCIIEETIYINTIAINGLTIGISDEGLFLVLPPLLKYVSSSILIPWNEISSRIDIDNPQKYILDLGNPKISTLSIFHQTVEYIHENYGEEIFFERLGKPS